MSHKSDPSVFGFILILVSFVTEILYQYFECKPFEVDIKLVAANWQETRFCVYQSIVKLISLASFIRNNLTQGKGGESAEDSFCPLLCPLYNDIFVKSTEFSSGCSAKTSQPKALKIEIAGPFFNLFSFIEVVAPFLEQNLPFL